VDDDRTVVALHLAWCFGKTFNKFRRSKLMISTISLGWLKSDGFVYMVLQAFEKSQSVARAWCLQRRGRVEITSAILIQCDIRNSFSIQISFGRFNMRPPELQAERLSIHRLPKGHCSQLSKYHEQVFPPPAS
jgi:hypothetical protein